MAIPLWVENLFLRTADRVYGLRPRSHPGHSLLNTCKIISHRGEHDNIRVFENTVAAFDQACEAGVWGIEFDIQWTRDHIPVVFHDEDLYRLFSAPQRIDAMPLSRLKEAFPSIPTLHEIVVQYGHRLHLMIELKAAASEKRKIYNERLQEILSPLIPRQEYHLLSLMPEIFDTIDLVEPGAFLPIARMNVRGISRLAAERGYGGINAHYALLSQRRITRHRELGQNLGTGYIRNRYTLYRELNRGVEWLFSNNAAEIQRICRGED